MTSRVTVTTNETRATTLVDADEITVLIAWNTDTTTFHDLDNALEETRQELKHQIAACNHIHPPVTADGGP